MNTCKKTAKNKVVSWGSMLPKTEKAWKSPSDNYIGTSILFALQGGVWTEEVGSLRT